MTTNKFYKSSNSFLCINFPQKMGELIATSYHSSLKSIHIMIFDINDISIKTLEGIIPICKRKKIHLIIHCFNRYDKNQLRMKLKKIKKDNYFHFQLTRTFIFSFSVEKQLIVKYKHLQLIKTNLDSSEIQEVTFK